MAVHNAFYYFSYFRGIGQVIFEESPLGPNALVGILSATASDIQVLPADHRAFILTFAKIVTIAHVHILHQRRPAPAKLAHRYHAAASNLFRLSDKMRGYSGGPPEVPQEWRYLTEDWGVETRDFNSAPGRSSNTGDGEFFSMLLGVYVAAFGRTPSPSADGPTARFFKALNTAIAESLGVQGLPWPSLSPATIIRGIRSHKGGDTGATFKFYFPVYRNACLFEDAENSKIGEISA